MNLYTNHIKLSTDARIKKLVQENKNKKAVDVAMGLSKLPVEERSFVVNQINGRRKAKDKFPFLEGREDIIYPLGTSIEQSSSEKSAKFKASLFKGIECIDLTCGFGIDAFFLSKHFKKISLVDSNQALLNVVQHNFENLIESETSFVCSKAEDYLKDLDHKVDLIFLDPSRRVDRKKVFLISDCEPNILELLPTLINKAKIVLIKLSPMADISDIIDKISTISKIYVITLNNECKEVLISISDEAFNGKINCVELGKSGFKYSFEIEKEKAISFSPSGMKKYAYLPNASITKAGAFKSVIEDFNVEKISGNTHIYTSDELIENFPGISYEQMHVLPYKKELLLKVVPDRAFNIIKRNFVDDIKAISNKLKIGNSGKLYLMAYRNKMEKAEIAVCKKISV